MIVFVERLCQRDKKHASVANKKMRWYSLQVLRNSRHRDLFCLALALALALVLVFVEVAVLICSQRSVIQTKDHNNINRGSFIILMTADRFEETDLIIFLSEIAHFHGKMIKFLKKIKRNANQSKKKKNQFFGNCWILTRNVEHFME